MRGWDAMTFRKPAVVLAFLGLGVAVTALLGLGPELKTASGAVVDVRSTESACPQEPWPFGCQWREPTRRVARTPRPS